MKFSILNCLHFLKFFPHKEEINNSLKNLKSIQFSQLTNFSLRVMATLRNRRKLVAVSGEKPKNTRNNESQNTLNPGMAEEYIIQVSEEIEGSAI